MPHSTSKPQNQGGTYYIWSAEDKPVSVHLNVNVAEDLEPLVREAHESLPRRGLEIGGLLLGRMRHPDPNYYIVSIEAFELIDSEHLRGPSFVLSAKDRQTLAKRIEKRSSGSREELMVVGMFRSHTRPGLYLDEYDFDLIRTFFCHPASVFLLIRPVVGEIPSAGFFFWEDGDIRREACYREFPFRAAELEPSGFSVSAPAKDARLPAVKVKEALAEVPLLPGAVVPQVPRRNLDHAPVLKTRVEASPPRREGEVEKLPAPAVSAPETPLKKPAAAARAPEAPPKQPAAVTITPETPPKQPAAVKIVPEALPKQPAAVKIEPETPPKQPAAVTIAPETPPKQPAAVTIAPETPPKQPAAVTITPETPPKQPAAVKIAPEVPPKQPAAVTITPETSPKQPAAVTIAPEAPPRRPAPAPPSLIDRPTKQPQAPDKPMAKVPAPGSLWHGYRWTIGAAAALILAALLFAWPGRNRDSRTDNKLLLRAERSGSGLQLIWDRSAPAVKQARSATVWITDGGNERELNLDRAQLASGSVLYWPKGNDVNFRLELRLPNSSVSESLRTVHEGPTNAGEAVSVGVNQGNDTRAGAGNREVQSARSVGPEPRTTFPAEQTPKPPVKPAEQPSLSKTPSGQDERARQAAQSQAQQRVAGPQPSEAAKVDPPRESAVGTVPGLGGLRRRPERSDKFVPPKPVREVNPNIPEELRTIETIDVRVSIDKEGRVWSANLITRDIDERLAAATVNAAMRWKFEPARLNGKLVNSDMVVHFKLKGRGGT